MRIALFGGGFDPVHNAHLALARTALDELALDQLRWVPTGQPWHKPVQLAPAEDRLAMLELALADPGAADARWSIEACELSRTGPSYTIDTVEWLQAREPGHDWFLVIGQDQHERLQSWHRWHDLLHRVTLAVAARPGSAATLAGDIAAHDHQTLHLPPMEVSSSALRQRIADGLPITELVPAAVAGYIESHRLYRDAVEPHLPSRS